MKNFAGLALFFSLSFAAFFLAATLLQFLSLWLDLARIIPTEQIPGQELADAAWKALPPALYLSILLALSYTARRSIPVHLAIINVVFLGLVFTLGASLALRQTGIVRPIFKTVTPIQAEPGLILSRSENTIVLLKESSEIRGPRLVSIPGQALIYQEVPFGPNNTLIRLPALPFGDDTPWFIRSMGIDFTLSAGELRSRLEDNYLSYAAYAFSLILLLSSLRFLLELSHWPLANLFLGALVFRGILALETFLNAGDLNALVNSFLSKRVPPMLITPLLFGAMGILIILYTLLTRIARPGKKRDD